MVERDQKTSKIVHCKSSKDLAVFVGRVQHDLHEPTDGRDAVEAQAAHDGLVVQTARKKQGGEDDNLLQVGN